MRIRAKTLLAFGVPTVVTLITGIVVVSALAQSLRTAERVNHTEQVIGDANALIRDIQEAVASIRGFALTGEDSFLRSYREALTTLDRDAVRLRGPLAEDAEQISRLDRLTSQRRRYADDVGEPVIAARAMGDEATLRNLVAQTGRALVADITQIGDELISTAQEQLDAQVVASRSAAATARVLILAGLGLVIALGSAIGLALSSQLSGNARAVTMAAGALAAGDGAARAVVRSADEIGDLARAFNVMADQLMAAADNERATRESLESSVREYSAFAARVAGGDLTARVGEIESEELRSLSDNLNGMVTGLADITGRVREGVQAISSATSEILASVSQHTASASQQSAAINETSTTVDEARAASEQTALRAREVAEQASVSAQVSDEGLSAVESIGRAMEDIKERVGAIARDILALSEQTQQIGEITDTVNDLADQSNILALNASIEAAKAGEHGRGFAVVATEVRTLAEQSKGATEQVRGILTDIQKATTAAVLATEQGSKVVEQGLDLSRKTGEGIRSLADTIRRAAEAAQQIAASAHQQSVGMDQIAHAMQDVNQGTTQFVAGARQSQGAAEDLNGLAGDLASLTQRYRV